MTAGLKEFQQPLVINIETQAFGRGIGVGPVDEKGDLLLGIKEFADHSL
jgi:hypothetical protein